MTEQEQIEKWREEFESGYSGEKDCFVRYPAFTDCYWFEKVQLHWEGFLMAKRSQPSVVLPKRIYSYPMHARKEIQDSLTAAGIKYTIGE